MDITDHPEEVALRHLVTRLSKEDINNLRQDILRIRRTLTRATGHKVPCPPDKLNLATHHRNHHTPAIRNKHKTLIPNIVEHLPPSRLLAIHLNKQVIIRAKDSIRKARVISIQVNPAKDHPGRTPLYPTNTPTPLILATRANTHINNPTHHLRNNHSELLYVRMYPSRGLGR
jgi:hypothetical protein